MQPNTAKLRTKWFLQNLRSCKKGQVGFGVSQFDVLMFSDLIPTCFFFFSVSKLNYSIINMSIAFTGRMTMAQRTFQNVEIKQSGLVYLLCSKFHRFMSKHYTLKTHSHSTPLYLKSFFFVTTLCVQILSTIEFNDVCTKKKNNEWNVETP